MNDASSSGSENLPECFWRFLHISLEEASDSDLWMEIHHCGDNNEMENGTWPHRGICIFVLQMKQLWVNAISQCNWDSTSHQRW
jgi:hypothetical protein